MADKFIKQINLGTASTPNLYDIYDEYARRRLEGLSNVYSISCLHEGSSSNTYVDYITGDTITYSTMAIANPSFKSDSESITISKTTGKTTYIVLESKTTAGAYYSVRFLDMNLGDTIYVIENTAEVEGKTINIPDRWLSNYVEDTSATFKMLDGKIDLKEYAKKTEAGKAGTYESTSAGAGSTSEHGAYTATGSVTISYAKADATTGSAGAATVTSAGGGAGTVDTDNAGGQTVTAASAGGATVDFSKASFTGTAGTVNVSAEAVTLEDHSYTPAGTISKVSAASHSHTVNCTTDTANIYDPKKAAEAGAHSHTVTVTGTITLAASEVKTATGTVTYTPAGSVSAVSATSHTHTVEVNTGSIPYVVDTNTKDAGSHSHTIDSHTHGADVEVVTGVTAAALTGTTSFNTDAIKSAALAEDSTSTYKFNTDAIKSAALTGTTTFNTDAIKDVTLSASTISTEGVKYVEDASYTDTEFNAQNVVTGYPSFSGGSLTGTKTFNTDAIKSISGTKNYGFSGSQSDIMTAPTVSDAGVLSWTVVSAGTQDAHTGDSASTGSVSFTAAALGTASTVSVLGSVKTAGTLSKTIKYMKRTTTAASTASVGITTTAATTKGIKITTTNASKGTVSITGGVASGTANVAGVGSAATLTSSTIAAHNHDFNTSAATFVTSIKSVSSAGAFNVTPSFTGTGVRLEAAGGTTSGTMSGTAESAGAHTHGIDRETITITYVKSATTSLEGKIDVTPTFTGTSATLAHGVTATTGTVSMTGTYTPEGTISGTQTIAAHTHSVTIASHTHGVTLTNHTHAVTIASHTHSIGSTDTSVTTSSVSVNILAHTHTIGNHTHSTTIPNCNS